jgi:tRNA-dihydrouridine synthase B
MESMQYFERFGILLNNKVVKTPLAIASMAGVVDAKYVLERAEHVGAGFIGGYSIDEKTLDASREMARAGRKEFIFDNPAEELEKQISLAESSSVVLGINLRGSRPASFKEIAEQFGDSIIYEIDAHCRQEPMVNAGCGEYLLHHPGHLEETIKALKSLEVTVSVKIRAGVSADDRLLAKKIWQAGGDIIHADLMDFGYAKIRQLRNSCPLFLIANNSINNFDKMKDMLSHGADMVSLARHSDSRTLAGLDAAITRFADEHGWYNSPKQLCRGGDLRSLTFCCMPVKNCPLIPTLEKIGMSREEYLMLKQEGVTDTPLEEGRQTCFGSLAWCCKDSSPCMFRDMTLREMGLSTREYMRHKHNLAELIMKKIFDESERAESG